ncbi:hypothetical protein ACI65C_005100 [Semiaphis heraclei]
MCCIQEEDNLTSSVGDKTHNGGEIIYLYVIRDINIDTVIYLRRFQREFSHVGLFAEMMRTWVKRARNFSRQFNIEFRLLIMLMRDTHYDGSIPEDETLMSNNSSPGTPRHGGDEYHRRLAGLPLRDSPNSDRQSPVFLQFGYDEMTQSGDSGYSINQDTQVENRDWHRVFLLSPSPRLSLDLCRRFIIFFWKKLHLICSSRQHREHTH